MNPAAMMQLKVAGEAHAFDLNVTPGDLNAPGRPRLIRPLS
jgi:hypothetical protein